MGISSGQVEVESARLDAYSARLGMKLVVRAAGLVGHHMLVIVSIYQIAVLM
jgi:hypothetical protein